MIDFGSLRRESASPSGKLRLGHGRSGVVGQVALAAGVEGGGRLAGANVRRVASIPPIVHIELILQTYQGIGICPYHYSVIRRSLASWHPGGEGAARLVL